MSISSCVYCQALDQVTSQGRGNAYRCPLCKTVLVKAPSGTTCRLVDGGPTRSNMPMALVGVSAIAAIAMTVAMNFRQPLVSPNVPASEPMATTTPAPVELERLVFPEGGASVKPGKGWHNFVSIKPSPRRPKHTAKGTDLPTPLVAAWNAVPEAPMPKLASAPTPAPFVTSNFCAGDLGVVPEVLLFDVRASGAGRLELAERAITKLAREIEIANSKEDKDGFIRKQIETRRDLAGLPFLLGDACRLSSEASKDLARFSLTTHMLLSTNIRSSLSGLPSDSGDFMSQSKRVAHPTALPAIDQILSPKSSEFRDFVVSVAKSDKSAFATKTLIRKALFDLDEDVRKPALAALAERPKDSYEDALIEGFRYPWTSIAWNAAHAVVALKRNDLVDRLESLLQEPSPDSPRKNHDRFESRELVRINHHKNCYLCHPPASATEVRSVVSSRSNLSFPIGRVPNPYESIPTSGILYYSGAEDSAFVKADVTYLRQDFSRLMPVSNAAPWPSSQRFDFLVRTKIHSAEEAEKLPTRTLAQSESGVAIRYAIGQLRKK